MTTSSVDTRKSRRSGGGQAELGRQGRHPGGQFGTYDRLIEQWKLTEGSLKTGAINGGA